MSNFTQQWGNVTKMRWWIISDHDIKTLLETEHMQLINKRRDAEQERTVLHGQKEFISHDWFTIPRKAFVPATGIIYNRHVTKLIPTTNTSYSTFTTCTVSAI